MPSHTLPKIDHTSSEPQNPSYWISRVARTQSCLRHQLYDYSTLVSDPTTAVTSRLDRIAVFTLRAGSEAAGGQGDGSGGQPQLVRMVHVVGGVVALGVQQGGVGPGLAEDCPHPLGVAGVAAVVERSAALLEAQREQVSRNWSSRLK